MQKLSKIQETYIREEEPTRIDVPKSELVQNIDEFANKKTEIIKTWTELDDHPEAEDMNSEVGAAFDMEDLDDEMQAAFDALDDGGMIYSSFEHSFWVKKKDKLIRVM